ncbi:hypothetical protein [Actinosynnema sp. NPDC020468]|uniref:recombination directionality factor n=1 Tax=Actinosynnema sp. NPDC020468 TaxID=3154488 RepID=UPI0033FF6F39
MGKLKGGKLVGRRPVALSEWRFVSDDEDVAERVSALFGGRVVVSPDDEARDPFDVETTTAAVEVVIESADALRSRMALYGQAGPIHVCDGAYYVTGHPAEDKVGQACGCPRSLADRKADSKAGTGPRPDISLKFRLADAPDLGYFLFTTGSWSLVNDLAEIERGLEAAPVRAVLRLELVEYTTKKGREVSYTRPVIEIKGTA